MKRNILLVLLLINNVLLYGQIETRKEYNVSQIQGIWKVYFNYTYPNPSDDASYTTFYIFKGKKKLKIDIDGSPYDKLSVTVSDYGFANSYFRDTICAMKNLNDTGQIFVQLHENADLKDCYVNIASIFELKPKKYLNLFGDECWYLEKAPKEVLEVLYKRGKHDKRDYIKEFLDINVCGIKTEKSYIYDSTYTRTKMYLIKDDIITILEEGDGFVKMEYETKDEKIIKGWIKKEDVECVELKDKSIK